MTNYLYKEEQRFPTPWIFLVIFPTLASVIFLLKFNEWNREEVIEVSEKNDILGLIIMGVIFFVMMVGLTILFYKMRLVTQIKSDGIYFKYLPFINKERFISKEEIKNYEVRKYNPNREFGGHGVKKQRRIRNSGKSYTVSGRFGLQLYLSNGDKILIGTHRREALKHAMDKMMNND
jgi:hypothetical protein